MKSRAQRILVVEDERGIAELIKQGLEAEGYAVTCAHDGEEGQLQSKGVKWSIATLQSSVPEG